MGLTLYHSGQLIGIPGSDSMELLNVPYFWPLRSPYIGLTHRIHGAAIYGNMDPINIPQMLAYIPYMDPMGYGRYLQVGFPEWLWRLWSWAASELRTVLSNGRRVADRCDTDVLRLAQVDDTWHHHFSKEPGKMAGNLQWRLFNIAMENHHAIHR